MHQRELLSQSLADDHVRSTLAATRSKPKLPTSGDPFDTWPDFYGQIDDRIISAIK
jgi:hypothetical protein